MVIYHRYDTDPLEMNMLLDPNLQPESRRTELLQQWSAAVDADFTTLLAGPMSSRLGFFVTSCFKHAATVDGEAVEGSNVGDIVGKWFSYHTAQDPASTGIEPADYQINDKDIYPPVSCNPTCYNNEKAGLKCDKYSGAQGATSDADNVEDNVNAENVDDADPCHDVAILAPAAVTIETHCSAVTVDTVCSDDTCLTAYKTSTLASCSEEDISATLGLSGAQLAIVRALDAC